MRGFKSQWYSSNEICENDERNIQCCTAEGFSFIPYEWIPWGTTSIYSIALLSNLTLHPNCNDADYLLLNMSSITWRHYVYCHWALGSEFIITPSTGEGRLHIENHGRTVCVMRRSSFLSIWKSNISEWWRMLTISFRLWIHEKYETF